MTYEQLIDRIIAARVNKIAAIVITIIALEAIALAQPPEPTAEELYARGQAAFDHKDYPTAIESWKSSYALSREPLLLFNLAQAYRLSGDCPSALTTYKQFVADDPTSDRHDLAMSLTRELETQCGAPPKVPTPTEVIALPQSSDDRREEHPETTLKIAGLVTSGAGIAAFATGLYLGSRAQAIGDEVTDACRTSCDWAAWKDKDARGRRYATIGRVLDVGGAVGIASGAVLYYLGVRQGTVTVAPRTRENGAIMSWAGSW